MIGRFVLMFIPSAISLGLLGAYLLASGTSVRRTILIIVISAAIMSVFMERIALEGEYYEDDEEDDDDTNES